jgi:hypothetical protein
MEAGATGPSGSRLAMISPESAFMVIQAASVSDLTGGDFGRDLAAKTGLARKDKSRAALSRSLQTPSHRRFEPSPNSRFAATLNPPGPIIHILP